MGALLKILHLSHGTLPDWRIEKCAISASRRLGDETIFAGLAPTSSRTETFAFTKIYKIGWTEGTKFGIPFYWHSTKKQLSNVLRETRPDIVHAHNIFSAKMIAEFGIPFVFDDHEYTSVYVRGLAEKVKQNSNRFTKEATHDSISKSIRRSTWNFILGHRAIGLWTKWERDLLVTGTDNSYC